MAKKEDRQDPEYEKWVNAFALYDREFQSWEKRAQKILKIYRRETNAIVRNTPAKFNILWSNIQTLVPAVYARIPKADVSRRFKDNDPVGRVASLLLERALDYEIENCGDFASTMRQSVYDRFLPGRATSWIRYEPKFETQPNPLHMLADAMGVEATDVTEEPEEIEVLQEESAPIDYVHWRDFGCTVARTWDEVTGVWRRIYMTRAALVERFGEKIGNKVPLDSKPPDLRQQRPYSADSIDARGLIYEVWDKENGKALWISKSMGQIIDERDDPLELPDFFPCPKPLCSTQTSDSLVPIPDYVLYEDQARSLDTLADRIHGLVEALKVRGVYDASIPQLARLLSEGENNTLVPVQNWNAFAEKQGLKGAVDLLDITMIGEALQQAYAAFEQIKSQIYEIVGLADIMRGVSQSEETLGAQQLKAHFGGNRLTDYQNQVAGYATQILRLKAHVICTKFDPKTLMKMGDVAQLSQEDQQLVPQAIELLRCDPCRSFRIDIEADSMVQIDEETDKQSRIEFLGAMGGFLKETMTAGQSAPQMAPLLVSMLEFGVRGFKIGKTLEGEIDNAMDKFKQLALQPPSPNPEMMKIQAQGQLDQQKMNNDLQVRSAELQQQERFKQLEFQLEERRTERENQLEAQRAQQQQQYEQQMELLRIANDKRIDEMANQVALMKALIEERRAIRVAQISKGTSETPEEQEAANFGEQLAGIMQALTQSHQILAQQVSAMNGPKRKTVVRGEDGRISQVLEEPLQMQ
jgi:hypothetical protein